MEIRSFPLLMTQMQEFNLAEGMCFSTKHGTYVSEQTKQEELNKTSYMQLALRPCKKQATICR